MDLGLRPIAVPMDSLSHRAQRDAASSRRRAINLPSAEMSPPAAFAKATVRTKASGTVVGSRAATPQIPHTR